MTNALIIVDMQFDFIEGTLAVPDAEAIIEPILEIEAAYEYVVASQDFHPESHCSFKRWPRHCVMGTPGVILDAGVAALDPQLVWKGEKIDKEAYSAFDGRLRDGSSLSGWLAERDVNRVDVCGLALDYCVRATALDAHRLFKTNVLLDLTRPVAWTTAAQAIADLAAEGVGLATVS